MSWLGTQVDHVDALLARISGRRRVVVDARTAMNFAILAPIFERLQRDRRVDVVRTAVRPEDVVASAEASGFRGRISPRTRMKWRRVDLCLSADPWGPIRLRR